MYDVTHQNGEFVLHGELLDGTDSSLKNNGYVGIGIYEPSNAVNVGGLFRSAYAMGAHFIFTIGGTYKTQKSDTIKSSQKIPLFRFQNQEMFFESIPIQSQVCAIDNTRVNRIPTKLQNFEHPQHCIYVLGKEIGGLSNYIIKRANRYVYLPTTVCLNVATMGSIVLYDRILKNR